MTVANRMALTPSVEIGIRQDGGDAETGRGMDVGAGLVLADGSGSAHQSTDGTTGVLDRESLKAVSSTEAYRASPRTFTRPRMRVDGPAGGPQPS